MDLHRNTAAIITDGNRAIGVNGYFNLGAITGKMFINRVIEYLKDTVMKPSLIRVTDVHPGALPNGFKTFEFVNLGCSIDSAACGVLLLRKIGFVKRYDRFGRWLFGHGKCDAGMRNCFGEKEQFTG